MSPERRAPAVTAGVRVRLAVLVGCAMLPLLALLFVGVRAEAAQARRHAHGRVADSATVAAARFQAWLEAGAQTLESVARLPEWGTRSPSQMQPLLRGLTRPGSPLLNVGVARPDGVVLASSLAGLPGVTLADREYFQAALQSQGLAVGDLLFGRLSRLPTVPLAIPVLDERGGPRAVAFAGLDLTALSQRLGADGVVTFLDPHGQPLLRSGTRGLSPDPLESLAVSGIPRTVEGEGFVAAAAPLRDLRGRVVGYVVLSTPVQDPTASRRAGRVFLAIALTALGLLLALLSGEVLLRRPLLRLARTVKSLGAGDLRARSGLADAPGVLGLLGQAFDRMAAHLEREILRSRLLLEAAGDGILGLDRHGRITFANAAASRMLRIEPERLHGRLLHDVVHADDPSHTASECPLVGPARTRRPRQAVLDEFHCGDGTELPVEWTGTPLEDPAGATREVLLFSDISRRLNLERQLQHAMKMEALGRLAASVAHDFNNVLTVLQGNSEFLLRSEADVAASRQAAEEIARACSRGKGLTERLLSLSRPRPQSRQVVDLNVVLSEFTRLGARLLGEDVHVSCRPHRRPVVVEADVSQVEHWLLNLAANARDAMPDGGSLFLETRIETDLPGLPTGCHAVLEVRDTGSGMEPEVLARAFEPFFTTKGEGKGTGLGLATLRAQVEEHGGALHVESAPGQGTRIAILLPASSCEAPVGTEQAAPSGVGRGETILVVDDDDSVRALIVRALGAAGYCVLEASRPELAEDRLRRTGRPVDLLLTDLVMPGVSGQALWQALRGEPLGPRRVLFMSGYGADRLEPDGTSPEEAFLEKPFSLQGLLAKVRERLD